MTAEDLPFRILIAVGTDVANPAESFWSLVRNVMTETHVSFTIVFSWEPGLGEFASCKFTEILYTLRCDFLMTAGDMPFKILLSVETVGSTTRDRASEISLVRFDVFAIIVVSFDVFSEVGNRKMKLRLPHDTYLSLCL